MANFANLPQTIRRADARIVPFEPETICRDLFTATQHCRKPDSFLARELTDGVLHFLTQSVPDSVPTEAEIAELVVKVVRELGHPQLAKAYETQRTHTRQPQQPVPIPNRYPADLLAAHHEGLLRLTDLATPGQLAGMVVGAHGGLHPRNIGIGEVIRAMQSTVGQFLAIDGSEYVLLEDGGDPARYAKELLDTLRKTNRHGQWHLHCGEPPSWAADIGPGTLFADLHTARNPGQLRELSLAMLKSFCERDLQSHETTVVWHLAETDLEGSAVPCLKEVLEWVMQGKDIRFGFDRPRKTVTLGHGLDRRNPAILSVVGVNLLHLVSQFDDTISIPRFLQKIGSLARFAKTAGHVRQDYLRQSSEPIFREGFLLERASLVVVPIGLDPAVRAVLGNDAHNSNAVAELAEATLSAMREALETDRPRSLFCRVNSADLPNDSIGLTDPHLLPRQQIRYAGSLHQACDGGRLDLLLHKSTRPDPETLIDLLRFAFRAEIAELRFCTVEEKLEAIF